MTKALSSDFHSDVPDIALALVGIHTLIHDCGIDRKLSHLVMLRASQINQCGYCVEMHTREAREDGETNERLDQLIVFRQSANFSDKERAALEWTEILTSLSPGADYKKVKNTLLEHFSRKQLAALTALIGMINTWNRIQISTH